MASSTSDPLQQEQLFQKALLAAFGIGALFVSFMSYTTRSFLDGTLPPAPPSAFAAFASTPGVPPVAGAAPGAVTLPPTAGPVGSGGPASIVNDLPVRVTDNFVGGRPSDGGIIGGSQTGSGQNQAGGGTPANATGGSGSSGNSGNTGAARGTPGQPSGAASGGNPPFTSGFPGGQNGGGGGGAIGGQNNAPPVVIPVPEPNFWIIAILGFAGIGGQMRRERAKGRAAAGTGSLIRA